MSILKIFCYPSLLLIFMLMGCASDKSLTTETINNVSATVETQVQTAMISPSPMVSPSEQKKVDNLTPKAKTQGFLSVEAGNNSVYAITNTGDLWMWGTESKTTTLPHKWEDIQDVAQIVAGTGHTLALKTDGTVWSWGGNDRGQLGDGTKISRWSPVQVSLGYATKVDAESFHSMALLADGTVWSWGDNLYGQLGSDRENNEIPERVPGLNNIIDISSGGTFSMALKNDGTVWVWGWGLEVSLGVDGYVDKPVMVPGINNIKAIVAAPATLLALKEDGTVWQWGNVDKPERVQGMEMIQLIAQGHSHSLAIDSAGTLWSWGNNRNGQLGNGSAANSNLEVPHKVVLPDAIIAVSGGDSHTLALDMNGQVWAWGSNEKGQLGSERKKQENLPIKIMITPK